MRQQLRSLLIVSFLLAACHKQVESDRGPSADGDDQASPPVVRKPSKPDQTDDAQDTDDEAVASAHADASGALVDAGRGSAEAGVGGVEAGSSADASSTSDAQALPADAASDTGSSTDSGDAWALCAPQSIDAYGTVPDVLIVFDRSSSMDIYGRWQPSKQAIKTITQELQGVMAFGLEFFPAGPPSDPIGPILGGPVMCGGSEKLDVPLVLNNAVAIAAALDATATQGMTPTGAALQQALTILGDRTPHAGVPSKPGFVLLVTDGDPACDPALSTTGSVDVAQRDAAKAAVKALKDKNIDTYVVGYQIDVAFQSIMNEMAQLGGTLSYRPAETGTQLASALREITRNVIRCSFDLSAAPTAPSHVRVSIDGHGLTLDGPDGWVIAGRSITLQGTACTTLRDGKQHDLSVQLDCP